MYPVPGIGDGLQLRVGKQRQRHRLVLRQDIVRLAATDEQYGPLIPEGQADVILGLEPVETMRVLAQYGHPEVIVIANSRPVYTMAVTTGAAEYPGTEEVARTLGELSRAAWVINATRSSVSKSFVLASAMRTPCREYAL